jgi:small subunit ribosomal protein S20
MANIKSSKKDIKRIAKKTVTNSATKVALKTYIKKTRKATVAGEAGAINLTLTEAVKRLDKAAQKGIIHPNQAARRKSRIAKAAAAALKAAGK